ncbi:hypothetical protein CANARDRAFT_198653 [[Candida] arabinofermentans NRRL YB-2248]|uniref:Protein kinase domain-containing protein n=1 Tax=[Candida] arabinofermentans NRRL YB-2248 TaxID=983967 RepID=A0A1E4T193_9ASCO|nr:hypothetical protein CANARDRAFT_198653 [[Candida] arabinofermentans NRRL YB-2248]
MSYSSKRLFQRGLAGQPVVYRTLRLQQSKILNFQHPQLARYSSTVKLNDVKPQKKKRKTKGIPYFKGFVVLLGSGYIYDTYFGNGIAYRTVHSLSVLIALSIDYKLHFEEGYDLEALHERNATRLYNLLIENKGLYIKLGQMIAIQGMMFPIQYQTKFSKLFDKAPKDTWEICDGVLREELGDDYQNEYFNWIDQVPVASASVAQVHKAELKNGELVAVKIQHDSVTKQNWSDLLTYRIVMKFYAWVFDMPLDKTVDYICHKMNEEVDFTIELKNGEKISKMIESEKEFKDSIYIPKYYHEISTKRILTAEWIEADLVSEYMKLQDKGYDIKNLMNLIVKVYSRQVFSWGLVHCDLHPGNLLVRKLPGGKNKQQLVILDHGLYEHFDDKFRKEYAEFWKYTMDVDSEKIKTLLLSWGINADDILIGLSSMDPKKNIALREHIETMKKLSYYERQMILRKKMKQFFENTDKFPMTLTFIMRSMRIVQGLNRNFGSPINRVEILAAEARKTVSLFELDKDDSRLKVLRRFALYNSFKIYTFIQFNLSKIMNFIKVHINQLFKKQVELYDSEAVYEDQLIQVSKGMGFEDVPRTSDLIK